MKFRWYSVEPFMLRFGLATTRESWNAAFRSLGVPAPEWPTSAGRCTVVSKPSAVRVIVSLNKPDRAVGLHSVVGLLAHEAWHVVEAVAEHINEHKPGSEFTAYMLQYVQEVLFLEYMRAERPALMKHKLYEV